MALFTEQVEEFFHYTPNKGAAVAYTVIFLIYTILLTARIHLSRSPSFLYILAITALTETIGHLYRFLCIDSINIAKYIFMQFFLLIPPNILPFVNYIALGQVIKLSNTPIDRFFLKPSFVAWFFSAAEVTLFWLQRATNLNATPESSNIGLAWVVIAFSIQSMLFASFIIIAAFIQQSPLYSYHINGQPNAKGRLITGIYITSSFLFTRLIYRIIEFITGYTGVVASTEWLFYTFDSTMVVFTFATYAISFPGFYLPPRVSTGDKSQYSQVSDLDDEEIEMLQDSNKHVAVFNNVQKVNYTISVDP